jgi:di/tricarboxylate transporter
MAAKLEFSKKLQLAKVCILGLVLIFAAVSWFVYHEIPTDFLTWFAGIIGFSDSPYMFKAAKENVQKIIEGGTAKAVAAVQVAAPATTQSAEDIITADSGFLDNKAGEKVDYK